MNPIMGADLQWAGTSGNISADILGGTESYVTALGGTVLYRLENRCTRKRTVGSNPDPSAKTATKLVVR